MSYKDLRNFTEMMRALGYHRLISMENFRHPNFILVAEVLAWLIKRYDPSVDLPTDIDTEQDRVLFIKSVAQYMATKAHIKLNTKKLYQSDGYAVKELLKVTSILYSAQNQMNLQKDEKQDEQDSYNFDISSKISDLKLARQLSSDIIQKGAALHELLGKEVELREKRTDVLSKQLELTDVEMGIRSAINSVVEEIQKTETNLENIAADEVNLDTKIEKKSQELERNQKRLATLQSVRPQYLDEYEKLEEELNTTYDEFILKFRNMAAMEQQMEDMERLENDKFLEKEQRLKELARKMKDDELGLGADAIADSDDELFGPGGAVAGVIAAQVAHAVASAGRIGPGGEPDTNLNGFVDYLEDGERPERNLRPSAGREGHVFGTMSGGLSDEDEDLSSGTGGDDVDLEAGDSEDELELGRDMKAGGDGGGVGINPSGSLLSPSGGSEDDF